MYALHEGVVVQERLAHPHEDQVDPRRCLDAAPAADPHPLAVEHRGHLSGDLASSQVAPHPQPRRQAELAVHRAAHLAGDADGGTLVAVRCASHKTGCPRCLAFGHLGCRRRIERFLFLDCGLAAVALLAAVAIGHPHCFDRLAVGHAHQIALGAVNGARRLRDLRQPHRVALCGEPLAKLHGQRRNLIERLHALLVECLGQLHGAILRLPQRLHHRAQLFRSHPKEHFRLRRLSRFDRD